MKIKQIALLGLLLVASALPSRAGLITSAEITFTIPEHVVNVFLEFDGEGTRAPSVGPYPYEYSREGGVVTIHSQFHSSAIDFNPSDILGSWAQTTNYYSWGAAYPHALVYQNQAGSINFDGTQVWKVPDVGTPQAPVERYLVYGLFALVYAPEIESSSLGSGLMIVGDRTSPIIPSHFASLAQEGLVIDFDPITNLLSISGTLLTGHGIAALDPGSPQTPTPFGTFNLTAYVEPIPEPSTYVLLGGGALAAAVSVYRKRRMASIAG